MTMTEIVTYDPAKTGALTPGYTDPTGGRLVAWAHALDAAHRIGTALCGTSFAPAAFRGKPDEAAAMILYGDELGLTPGAALQSGFVVGGRPGLYARAMAAIVMAKGHEVWTVEKSDAKVTVAGRRKGSTHQTEETWTTGRAQKAGYMSNKKYATDPQSMLYARALADVCRQIAPDALAGLDYTVEELELSAEPVTVTVTRTPAPRSTSAQRKTAPPMPEPDLTPGVTTPPSPFVEVEAIEVTDVTLPTLRSDAQMRKLWALAKDHQLDEAGFRTYLAEELGREVETTKTLTAAEAHKLIEQMEGLTATEEPSDMADPEPPLI